MKHVLGTIAIVLCARAGVFAAPQRPIEATHTPKCTVATLKGRYLFGGIATLVPPASEGQALLAVAGYHVFNGDGTGKDFTRLTHFNGFEGGKASNPVVSTDGRFMAFQYARTTDPAGVGYGLLLYWFKK
jgi:hypothetical protein